MLSVRHDYPFPEGHGGKWEVTHKRNKKKLVELLAYPEQQLPGVPHELGVPQQPPKPGPVGSRDEALTVL